MLALIVNLVAALVFIAVADIDWAVAGLIAVGSVVGGPDRRDGRAPAAAAMALRAG